MEIVNCPICGTQLYETTLGNKWCPNHGKITKEEESKEEEPSYIG